MTTTACCLSDTVVYGLTPADGNPASRANLQFVLFFKAQILDQAKTSNQMRTAFYQAMSCYPIVYGKLERQKVPNQSDRAQIVVTEKTRKELAPSYRDHAVLQTVEEIQQAEYNWKSWPKELMSIDMLRSKGTEDRALVQCVVTWHPDGVGILFSIDHSVADGVGVDILLSQWSCMMRKQTDKPDIPVDFDHEAMYRGLGKVENEESNWFVDMVDSVDLSQQASSATGAIVETDPRTPKQVEESLRQNVHMFEITPESLDRLQSDMVATGTHVSVIRLAYALLWQRYMVCLSNGTQADSPDHTCLINVIHSTRDMINQPYYIGNAVCPLYVQLPMSQIQKMSVTEVAEEIGQHMHKQTKSSWVSFLAMMQDPIRYTKFLTVFGNPEAKQLTVSNITRLSFFSIDFGFGLPSFVTVYPALIPGFAVWLPLSGKGGIRIVWNIADDVFSGLVNDQMLAKYVNVVF
ncbi:hypothetical protein LPJ57_004252 [Coemansia sp. RSA 486]|nr:hypothetical protein LPJ57_004252 [Coemansia sp. RSA 486]KAJ2231272.1 hypothetical protein IWW45_005527 [Coemansia sp. RSA 485]